MLPMSLLDAAAGMLHRAISCCVIRTECLGSVVVKDQKPSSSFRKGVQGGLLIKRDHRTAGGAAVSAVPAGAAQVCRGRRAVPRAAEGESTICPPSLIVPRMSFPSKLLVRCRSTPLDDTDVRGAPVHLLLSSVPEAAEQDLRVLSLRMTRRRGSGRCTPLRSTASCRCWRRTSPSASWHQRCGGRPMRWCAVQMQQLSTRQRPHTSVLRACLCTGAGHH